MIKCTTLDAAILAAVTVSPAFAANVDVQMLNRGEMGAMVFEPGLVEIQPGDTVTFIPTDKSHNAETIPGMLPEGAEPFKGKLNESITVAFDVPGAYGIKCMPHFPLGMVALVIVGPDPANLEEIKSVNLPNKAKERFESMYAELAAE